MAREYIKSATKTAHSGAPEVQANVRAMLDEIEEGREVAALRYAARLVGYDGPVVLTAEVIEAASAQVPQQLKDDIAFAHRNIEGFARAQKATLVDFEHEVLPGFIAGPAIAAGLLERILPRIRPRRMPIVALWPPVAPMPPKLRLFIDHLVAELGHKRPW